MMDLFLLYYVIGIFVMTYMTGQQYEALMLLLSNEVSNPIAVQVLLCCIIAVGALVWPIVLFQRR